MYYDDGDEFIILRDGSGAINHSFQCNSQCIKNKENKFQKLYSVALRDIKAGEEMTEDYSNYVKNSNNWVQEMLRKYKPSRLQFQKQFGIKKKEQEKI